MNVIQSNLLKVICLIACFSFFMSCTHTTTKEKKAVFAVTDSVLTADLKDLIHWEKFNVNGTEKTTGNKVESVLEIEITNVKDLPADELKIKDLGKKLAAVMKHALKDPNEYNSYEVSFVSEEVMGDMTKSTSKKIEFKSGDL